MKLKDPIVLASIIPLPPLPKKSMFPCMKMCQTAHKTNAKLNLSALYANTPDGGATATI